MIQTWMSFSDSLLFSVRPIDEIGTLFVAGGVTFDPTVVTAATAALDEARTLLATNFPGPFLDLSVVSLAKPCPFMTR